jgi:hypothetical protein
MDTSDVAMLCAVVQHDSSLQILRSIDGLHALASLRLMAKSRLLMFCIRAQVFDGVVRGGSKVPRNHLPELNREVESASFRVFANMK